MPPYLPLSGGKLCQRQGTIKSFQLNVAARLPWEKWQKSSFPIISQEQLLKSLLAYCSLALCNLVAFYSILVWWALVLCLAAGCWGCLCESELWPSEHFDNRGSMRIKTIIVFPPSDRRNTLPTAGPVPSKRALCSQSRSKSTRWLWHSGCSDIQQAILHCRYCILFFFFLNCFLLSCFLLLLS